MEDTLYEVKREEWIRKAGAVARFGSSASTSEWGAYEGMPHLSEALRHFNNFDKSHRMAILDFVTVWANYQASGLPSLVHEMSIEFKETMGAIDKPKEE